MRWRVVRGMDRWDGMGDQGVRSHGSAQGSACRVSFLGAVAGPVETIVHVVAPRLFPSPTAIPHIRDICFSVRAEIVFLDPREGGVARKQQFLETRASLPRQEALTHPGSHPSRASELVRRKQPDSPAQGTDRTSLFTPAPAYPPPPTPPSPPRIQPRRSDIDISTAIVADRIA